MMAAHAAPTAGGPTAAAPGENENLHINQLLSKAVAVGASDVHLAVGIPPRFRVSGDMMTVDGVAPLRPQEIRRMVYSILTQLQRERFEAELELDASHSVPGFGRFRLNVFLQRDSLGAVFRVIPWEVKPLEELGLPAAVGSLAQLQRGLVLVTGPTGSGKSTTLASLIDIVNTQRAGHIVTVEDPIEFLHAHKRCIVNQRQVGEDTRSFGEALKHVLRQDPDVILVGEMRDLETIAAAVTAAETGHLVFGTLHTQDAAQSVDRMVDVFPSHQQQQVRVQLSNCLQGVVTQQLIPLAKGGGRAVASELLIATPAVRNLIREGKTHQIYSTMQSGGRFGMQTMDMSLAALVRQSKITLAMALDRGHSPEDIRRLVQGT
ncbi:MAG: type IV pilus twitching motility protein PilT [Acidimicrobiales bacterium]